MTTNSFEKKKTCSITDLFCGGLVYVTSMVFFLCTINSFNIAEFLRPLLLTLYWIVIISSLILYIKKRRDIADRTTEIGLISAYIIVRVISLIINDSFSEDNIFLTISTELFYIIGVSEILFCENNRLYKVMDLFLIFDICSIAASYYFGFFRPDKIESFRTLHAGTDFEKATCIFIHPNTAGIVAGCAIAICISIIVQKERSKSMIPLPVILFILAVNCIFLFQSKCRSAETGAVVVTCAYIICYKFRLITIKRAACIFLLTCIASIGCIAVYVYASENSDSLSNNSIETMLDEVSSRRYTIWKATLLSQKENIAFGFGTQSKGVVKRAEYLIDAQENGRAGEEWTYAANMRLGPHNGYLGMYSAAGLTGSLLFFVYVYIKMKKSNCENLWLLLIFILWIDYFESLFVVSSPYFTCLLFMVYLRTPQNMKRAQMIQE